MSAQRPTARNRQAFLLGLLGISAGGLLGSLVTATLGAIVLIALLRVIKK